MHVRIPILHGCSLTEFRSGDKAAFIEHFREKEISDHALTIPFPYGEADADAYLKIVEESLRKYGRHVQFAIRRADDFLVGGVGFKELEVEGKGVGSHRAEIGYWVAKPYWGRGIATAAVGAACARAFAEFGLEKITAHVFAGNLRSARVLDKAGFQKEGELRKHYRKQGKFLDAWAYGLLRTP